MTNNQESKEPRSTKYSLTDHSAERFVVYDDKGVIFESDSEEDVRSEYASFKRFWGDLVLARIVEKRRYPVYAKFNKQGKVTQMRVVFREANQ